MIEFIDLEEITGGKIIRYHRKGEITHLLTDSRKIIQSAGALFFAIRGERHDGHHYISELHKRGIRQFVIESDNISDDYPSANFLAVESSIDALQKIAAYHRKQFTLPILAITGSNGKTIVKEWLSQMLATKLNVVKSPNSYNSQIGVPLSAWQISSRHEIGIFEAGISRANEMERLEAIIRPLMGIFTNIGSAHDYGFKSRVHKIREKVKLFNHCQTVFYCKDHEEIVSVLENELPGNIKLFSWSMKGRADVNIINLKADRESGQLLLEYQGDKMLYNLPFKDHASIENCLHCISFLLYEGFDFEFIQKGINSLSNVPKRLELKQGINDCYIIDDTYNNDLVGLQIALDFLVHQKHKEKKTVILSDMLQSGREATSLYGEISGLLQAKGVYRLIGIGEDISSHRSLFPMPGDFYRNTEEFLSSASAKDFNKEVILIKGARVFTFEKIVQQLQQKIHGTVLEINLDALSHNLNYYRSRLKSHTKIMVMVKAFAYGSGSFEIANLLQFHRVDYLAVAYTDEGVALREHGIHIPVMVMNPSAGSFGKILKYKLEPEIYSFYILDHLIRFMAGEQDTINIHLKLDTGMHRLGFEGQDLDELAGLLKANPRVRVSSIFSHMAGADEDIHTEFSFSQVEKFKFMAEKLTTTLQINPLKHILNSAGIIRFPEYQFDMVRLGIGLYGVEASQLQQKALQPISTLKSTISQIKKIKKGETVGYDRKGVAKNNMKIATIAIGYADGLDRRFSNGIGLVLVHGKPAPVVGNVCMDMTMVDISHIEANEGDEVIIFGRAKDGKEINISEMAVKINTIAYEILTSISERVKRVFFTE